MTCLSLLVSPLLLTKSLAYCLSSVAEMFGRGIRDGGWVTVIIIASHLPSPNSIG